jgi:hypothetical protein
MATTPARAVQLDLSIVPADTGISGTVARPGFSAETFSGWLELTAAIARLLAAKPTDGERPVV